MTGTPAKMTEMPFSTSVPGPNGFDVLSDALRMVRASGALLLRGEFSAPWIVEAPESAAIARLVERPTARLVSLHIVAEGRCWVEVPGVDRISLDAGEVVLFPRGHGHRIGSGVASPMPVAQLVPPPPWTDLPVLRHGGDGAATRIVCCYLRCDDLLFNPFLDALPAVLAVRGGHDAAIDWFRASVRYIIAEASNAGPGSSALLSRLTELLFIEVLRIHIGGLRKGEVGWFAALRDRFVSRALHAMHARPAHPWTVDELACRVGLSRSALMARFRRLLSQPPMRYLMLWRLQIAARRLHDTDDGIAEIAGAVGYGSEAAFSRAFKRFSGRSPADWRRVQRSAGTLEKQR